MKKNIHGYVYVSELTKYPKLYAELMSEFAAQGKAIDDYTTVFDISWSATKRGTDFWPQVNNGFMDAAKERAPELFDDTPYDTPLSERVFKKRDQVWSSIDDRVYEVREVNGDVVVLEPRTGIPDIVGPRSVFKHSLQLATRDQIFAEAKLRFPDGCVLNYDSYTNVIVNHHKLKITMSSGGLDITSFGVPYLLINGHWKTGIEVTLSKPEALPEICPEELSKSTSSATVSKTAETNHKNELLEEARKRFRPGKRYVFKYDKTVYPLERELEWQTEDYISTFLFPIVYHTGDSKWREAEKVYDKPKQADEPIVWKIQGPNTRGSLLNPKANTKSLDTSAVAKEVRVPLLKRKNTSRKL